MDQRVCAVGHVQGAVAMDSESKACEVQYRARVGEVDRVGLIDVVGVVDRELSAVLDGDGDARGEVERAVRSCERPAVNDDVAVGVVGATVDID